MRTNKAKVDGIEFTLFYCDLCEEKDLKDRASSLQADILKTINKPKK